MLTTRVRPTSGHALVGGVDVDGRPRPRARAARGSAPTQQPRSFDLDPPQPDFSRRLPWRSRSRGGGARRAVAERVRLGGAWKREARPVLGRPGTASDDRSRADAPAAGAVSRRAHHRLGPGGAAVRVGSAARAAPTRRHLDPHDTRHARGGPAGGEGGNHGSRQVAGAGHARCTDALASGQRHARALDATAERLGRRAAGRRLRGADGASNASSNCETGHPMGSRRTNCAYAFTSTARRRSWSLPRRRCWPIAG